MLDRRFIKKKKLNNKKMLIIFCIIMFFLGTAYSTLNQNLNLTGSVKIYNDGNSHGHLKKGNMDAYVVGVQSIWKAADGWNIDMTIRVHNPNNFDTTNWDATILVPGLRDASSYNLNDLKVEPDNEVIIVTNVDGSDQGRVKIDETRDYGMKVVASNLLIEEVLKNLTDEEKALMTDSDRETIYGGASNALSEDFKNVIISKLIYNMDATPEPTPNVIEIVANTTYEAEYELKDFSYTCGDLTFDVKYTSYVRWDGRYITTAEIAVTNNNTEYDVEKFSFDMLYNEPLEEAYYNSVVSNWNNDGNGNAFADHENINQTAKTQDSSSYESNSSNGCELKAGETKKYHITQITTQSKFKSFTFGNVEYVLSNGESGGSGGVEPSPSPSPVDPEKPDVTDDQLSFSYSYEKLNWGYDLVNATVTIKNNSDKEIKNCTFDLYYDVPLSEARYNNPSAWHPVEIVEKTREYVSIKLLTSIAANSEITFTIQQIEAETGFTDFIVKNIKYN